MKLFICIIYLSSFFYNGFAQQILLTGKVSIINSKYKTGKIQYVTHAYISASYSKPDYSDEHGEYILEFVGIDTGVTINIKAEKTGLEIVNKRELQEVILGRKNSLPIYLAPEGYLDRARAELYDINIAYIEKKKDDLIKRLRSDQEESTAAIRELEMRFGQNFIDRLEAESYLLERIEELKKRIPQLALELASKNLDFASKLYRKAYELFKKGDVEGTIKTLNDNILSNNYQKALAIKKESKKLKEKAKELQEIGQLSVQEFIKNYKLKIKSYRSDFTYNIASAKLDTIIKIVEENPAQFNDTELSNLYANIAFIFNENGDFQKGLGCQIKSLEILANILDPKDPILGLCNENIGVSHSYLGNHQTALVFYKKALIIQKKSFGSKHPNMFSLYNDIGLAYQKLGKEKLEKKYFKKANNIR